MFGYQTNSKKWKIIPCFICVCFFPVFRWYIFFEKYCLKVFNNFAQKALSLSLFWESERTKDIQNKQTFIIFTHSYCRISSSFLMFCFVCKCYRLSWFFFPWKIFRNLEKSIRKKSQPVDRSIDRLVCVKCCFQIVKDLCQIKPKKNQNQWRNNEYY